ncbi:MAG: tetratricopeptide repeat protein [Bryobacteraceae bacterium]
MDRLTRHELKTDKFVEEVGHTVHFLEEHRQAILRYGSIALALILIAAAVYGYTRTKRAERQLALGKILDIYNAPVMDPPPAEITAFRSEEEKSQAIVKGCNELIQKYAGSDEAALATYLLGANAADQGDLDAAERYLKSAAEEGSREYASLAQFALAQLYISRGKEADAEKILRALIEKPTVLVTKEQASLKLAELLKKSKPEEARKLAAPLQNKPGAVGRAAVSLLAELGRQQGS